MSQWHAHDGTPVVSAAGSCVDCAHERTHGQGSVSGPAPLVTSPPGSDAAGVQVEEGTGVAPRPESPRPSVPLPPGLGAAATLLASPPGTYSSRERAVEAQTWREAAVLARAKAAAEERSEIAAELHTLADTFASFARRAGREGA